MAASSIVITLLVCFFFCLVVNSESASVNVGGADGWDFGAEDWPKGKSFKAGDVLVFKYFPGVHNVVVVDADGYNSCSAPSGAKTYTSGNDQITLAKGDNYFLCSFKTHCDFGMRIAVKAT